MNVAVLSPVAALPLKREWWLSVDIPSSGMDTAEIRQPIEAATEQYPMVLLNGKRLVRGIFTVQTMQQARNLLEVISGWSSALVHVNGEQVRRTAIRPLIRQLACFSAKRPCGRDKHYRDRLRFVGCHLVGRVRFWDTPGLSRLCASAKSTWWFSFGNLDDQAKAFILDKDGIRAAAAASDARHCPGFPAERVAKILAALPDEISLGNQRLWLTKERYRCVCRVLHVGDDLPAVLPANARRYLTWLKNRLDYAAAMARR